MCACITERYIFSPVLYYATQYRSFSKLEIEYDLYLIKGSRKVNSLNITKALVIQRKGRPYPNPPSLSPVTFQNSSIILC